jgi:translation initiation factor 6
VFSRVTNSYALVCNGGAQNFYSVFESELADHMPVVRCTIAGCRFVGRVTAGENCFHWQKLPLHTRLVALSGLPVRVSCGWWVAWFDSIVELPRMRRGRPVAPPLPRFRTNCRLVQGTRTVFSCPRPARMTRCAISATRFRRK